MAIKLAKKDAKIMSIDELYQIFKPKYILDTLSIKSQVDNLIAIFTNAIEINFIKNPIENSIQQNNWQHLAWPHLAINISYLIPAISVPAILILATLVPVTLIFATLVSATIDPTTTNIPYLA